MLLHHLLTARKFRFKLGQARGGLIHLQCGVDMGNGLSPWLFCLALDPLLYQLGTLGSPGVSAYMDDVSVPWFGLPQLTLTQRLIREFGKASGLTVAPHHCFHGERWIKARGKVALKCKLARGESWRVTLRLLTPHRGILRAGGRVFHVRGRRSFPRILRELRVRGLPVCQCAPKQTVLPQRHPTNGEQEGMHSLPWGPANFKPAARLLGFTLASRIRGRAPWHWAGRKDWAKALAKVTGRVGQLAKARRSFVAGVRMWNTYVLPCVQYVAPDMCPPRPSWRSCTR